MSCFPFSLRFRSGRTALFLPACLVLCGVLVSGQTRVMKQLEEKRKVALEEIEWTAQLLKDTRSTAQNSLDRLQLLSEQIAARQEIIGLLNQEIALMDKEIAEMNGELGKLEDGLSEIRNSYARSLQNMRARHSIQYKWFFVLSAENFTQSFRRMRYLREYSGWQKRQVAMIIGKQTELGAKQLEREQVRTEKMALLDIRGKESGQLLAEEAEQKQEVLLLNRRQKELQAELSQKRTEAEALDRQIENLIGLEVDRAARAGAKTDAPLADRVESGTEAGEEEAVAIPKTESGSRSSKTEVKLSPDFASNRGRLPYPLTGKYKIVTRFGEHQHSGLPYVRTYSTGIDIRATAGAEAQAVFNGKVTAVFTAEAGFTQGVIVRHGKYLTVYANLSEVYVHSGDKVSTRQKLGKIFTDSSRETRLHFEIRKEKEKLNPRHWLR
ncbi:MAG: peptidoglycan DD-metalloendopeptidase family protein [Tannerella sp.]|jgi:septal ring factor EnvC (AmiA/AmiB activator)|nr:peptidoglycan DD-metalloendopeptidase family protein [Tannerella sp.]